MNIPDRIELYLENKLSPLEKAGFESEMLVNSNLAEEVERRKEVIKNASEFLAYDSMFTDKNDKKRFTHLQEVSMEEDIIAFHKDYDEKDKQKLANLRKVIRDVIDNNNMVREVFPVYRLAISLVIFILITGSVSYYLYQSNKRKSENATFLAAKYFNPGNDEFLSHLIHETEVLRNIIELEPDGQILNYKLSNNLLLIEAVSDMNNNETQKAKEKLKLLIESDKSDIAPSILWYYALAYAREGNYREASRILAKIEPLSYYHIAGADSILYLLNRSR